MGRLEFRDGGEDAHLALLRHRRQSARQFPDNTVFPSAELFAVDRRLSERDAVFGHRRGVVDHFRGVQQCLRRNTADVQANAAQHRVALDEDHVHTDVGRPERGRIAAGTRADDDQLSIVRRRAARRVLDGGNLAERHLLRVLDRFDRHVGGTFRRLQRRDETARRNLVADADVDRYDAPRDFRRHVHRRLVRLDRDQRVFDGNAVSGCYQHLDDFDVLELAQVGNEQLYGIGHYGIAFSRDPTSASVLPRNVVKRTAWAPSITRWS